MVCILPSICREVSLIRGVVIITDRYGASMADLWPDGGRLSWLENTGDPNMENWTRYTIGSSPGMHRIAAGHFTRKDRVQVCSAPILAKSSNFDTPAPITIYTAPDTPNKTHEFWPAEIAAMKTLTHEIVVVPDPHGGLDRILIASRNGVDLIWFHDEKWHSFNVGSGLSSDAHPGSPYWGTGSVSYARVRDDYAGYIGSSEVRYTLRILKIENNRIALSRASTETLYLCMLSLLDPNMEL